jgi:hypothetical protein
MASERHGIPEPGLPVGHDSIEMPRPTVAPLVLSLGMVLMAAGVATSPAFLFVGGLILVAGLSLWVVQLLPGEGHMHESRVEPARRPTPVTGTIAAVEHMQEGMAGYRMRVPSEVHPISAGIKGGLVGGLVMPVPALAYGLLSGHGIWYPVNLLAGMAIPGIGRMPPADLERFQPTLFLVAIVTHVATSLVFGTTYGVLLPTLPPIHKPFAWGGLLIPLFWTAVSYGVMGFVNRALARGVDWPWFIASQFVFGIVLAAVIARADERRPVLGGLLGGIAGGLLMPIPAVLWGLLSGRGVWYPINLLAGMVLRKVGEMPAEELSRFHPEWITVAVVIHAVMSVGIGLLFGALVPRLRPIPAAVSWGGLLIPMLWTGVSYGLMGVVNPLLQRRVDWPWFIVSQFVFGLVAAAVVVRSEKIYIPPAGRGRDRVADGVVGQSEGQA